MSSVVLYQKIPFVALCSLMFSLICTTAVSVFLFLQDPSVIQLTQDLAKSLGLKIRKAYVRMKVSMFQNNTLHILKGKCHYPSIFFVCFCFGNQFNRVLT